ncbi:threonine dehydrogenase [Xylogone sp. PMI_703]|nr:threonine dehydrogenase [Xylogone sp. PMI_703]
MKAARFYGARDIRVEDVGIPVGNDEKALVAVEWCGICGSDLHEYAIGPLSIPSDKSGPHPLSGEKLPVIMGHEFTGRIIQAPRTSSLKKGQAVMIDPRLYCSSCKQCQNSATNGCEKLGFLGISGGGGGLSEIVAVDPTMLHVLPDSVDLSVAAVLEPIAVAWHAVRLSGITDWKSTPVLVVGGGPIGVAVIHVLRAWGATNIIISEPTRKRHDFLKTIADTVLNPRETSIATECRKLTENHGVAVGFDCAGTQHGMNNALDSLRFKGVYVNIAIPETAITLQTSTVLVKELVLKSSLAYDDKDFRETVEAFVAGKFKDIGNMITSRISLEDVVEKGFEELLTNRDGHIKILVTPKARVGSKL